MKVHAMLITGTAGMDKKVLLGHGSGGSLSQELIRKLFHRYFSNPVLDQHSDSAVLAVEASHIAFTTDSFVIDPVFFPGGDIGKLAIAGTVNDLAVSGAVPKFITTSFIIEEGFLMQDLEKIVQSMAEEARYAGVTIVAGDTKVVNRGKCDKIFITTSGVGLLEDSHTGISTGAMVHPGDKIILNGAIGDHGMAVLAAREFQYFRTSITSDCKSLNHQIRIALNACPGIRFMRDATRGGLATVMVELAQGKDFGIEINEMEIPVHETVRGICELLGYDPMYVANEGKFIAVVPREMADTVIKTLKMEAGCDEASVIGEIVREHPGKVWLNTTIGGKRIMDMLAGEQLPRIC
jgi:hydrogenase expression/formation protein HypE